MKKSFLNFLIAIIFLLSIISNIQAEIKGKIIVKVGNKIITSYDLENEIKDDNLNFELNEKNTDLEINKDES